MATNESNSDDATPQETGSDRVAKVKEQVKSYVVKGINIAVEDVIEFAKSRPILTALIAIETGSWVVRSIKRFIKSRIRSNTVLELELQGDYTKEGSGDPISDLLNQSDELTFNKLLVTIYHAAHDSRVRCIFIRMDSPFTMGTAQYEEFRRTLYYFKMYNCGKKDGLAKKIIVYADGFGSYGTNALGKYYIATVADKIYMPKIGNLFFGPVTIDYPFINDTLSKLSMEVEVRRRAEFKSALNMFMKKKFDKYHKKQYSDLISTIEYNFIQTIAMARKLRPFKEVTFNIPNKSTFTADEDDDTNSKLEKYDNWSYFGNGENNFDLVSSVEWCVDKVLENDRNLQFELPPKKKAKNTENSANSGNGDKKALLNLVRCWSDKVGTYNDPRLYLILQFWDKQANKAVFYQCLIGYPSLAQTKGSLQQATEKEQEAKQELQQDENTNEDVTTTTTERVMLSMKILVDYPDTTPYGISENKSRDNGDEDDEEEADTYQLIKKGDILIPPSDRAKDEDFKRGDIIDKVQESRISINRNVIDIIHHGSYLPQEALELGLIDGVKYYYEMYEYVLPNLLGFEKIAVGNVHEKQKKNEKCKVNYLYMKRYYQRCVAHKTKKGFIGDDWICQPYKQFTCDDNDNTAGESIFERMIKKVGCICSIFSKKEGLVKIAYIKAHGAIQDGESEGNNLGSKTLIRALRACRVRKKGIKGVILDLDTPGGAATACENMYNEILQCRKFGIPVIGIQSNVAASGGYYLSAPCDWVISSNFTITGSIGIIAGKLKTRGFWYDKLGINYDRVSRFNENSEQFSQLDGIGTYERKFCLLLLFWHVFMIVLFVACVCAGIRMEKLLTQWYHGFKSVISEPRKISMDQLETVAKGQVWLGSKAHEFGLVDEIGGIWEAIRKCKELIYKNKCQIKKKEFNSKLIEKQKVLLVNPLGKASLMDALFGEPVDHENDFSKPRNSINGTGIMTNSMDKMRYLIGKSVEYSSLMKLFMNTMCLFTGVNNTLSSSMLFSSMLNNANVNNGNIANMGVNAIGNQIGNQLGMIAKEISLCCGTDAIDKYNCRHSLGYASYYEPGLSYLSQQLKVSL